MAQLHRTGTEYKAPMWVVRRGGGVNILQQQSGVEVVDFTRLHWFYMR